MEKPTYEVEYSTEHLSGSFTLYDEDAAKSTAIDILMTWMMDERTNWDPDTGIPTQEQIDFWNNMIGTCTVFVYKRTHEKEEPDEENIIWDMNDRDLNAIGWTQI